MADELPKARDSLAWQRPSRRRRYCSAIIDLVAWTAIWLAAGSVLDASARRIFQAPHPTGLDPRDGLNVICMGIGALCANLCLAFAAAAGTSVGKDVTGLRLVARADPSPVRPGFARGLLRSAAQALPCMGVISVLTGLHDTIAGTRIVHVADATRWYAGSSRQQDDIDADTADGPDVPGVSAWKVAPAILVHVVAVAAYTVLSAI